MQFTFVLRKKIVFYIEGDPEKGTMPVVSGELNNPQITIDPDKGKIVISEDKK